MNKQKVYWSKNLKYIGVLMSIWFVVSFGCGILLKDFLKQLSIRRIQTWILVCTARCYLCVCPFDFHICTANESSRQRL